MIKLEKRERKGNYHIIQGKISSGAFPLNLSDLLRDFEQLSSKIRVESGAD